MSVNQAAKTSWLQCAGSNSRMPAQEPIRKAGEKLADACWKGYEAYGMKMKDGRRVPNCVPVRKG